MSFPTILQGYHKAEKGHIIKKADKFAFSHSTFWNDCDTSIGHKFLEDADGFKLYDEQELMLITKDVIFQKLITTIICNNKKEWIHIRKLALSLGWKGYGPTLDKDREFDQCSYRWYPDTASDRICSGRTSNYETDGMTELELNASTQMREIAIFLATNAPIATKKVSTLILKVGNSEIHHTDKGIRIGIHLKLTDSQLKEIYNKRKEVNPKSF